MHGAKVKIMIRMVTIWLMFIPVHSDNPKQIWLTSC